MWLLLAFILVPMIEIALFIQVGGAIGLGWTLAIVLLTAVIGTWLVRAQGVQTMDRLRRSFNDLSDPSEPLADGAMILFAGALLLTPGFFTDAVGFLLLTPPFRRAAFAWAKRHVKVQSFAAGVPQGPGASKPRGPATPRPRGEGDIIDGEFTEIEPGKRPTHNPSQWTRH